MKTQSNVVVRCTASITNETIGYSFDFDLYPISKTKSAGSIELKTHKGVSICTFGQKEFAAFVALVKKAETFLAKQEEKVAETFLKLNPEKVEDSNTTADSDTEADEQFSPANK